MFDSHSLSDVVGIAGVLNKMIIVMLYFLLCVSGALCYRNPGYHYPSPRTPSQPWYTPPAVNGSGDHSYQTDNINAKQANPWHGTHWDEQGDNQNNNNLTQSEDSQDKTHDSIQSETQVKGQNNCESRKTGNEQECQDTNVAKPQNHEGIATISGATRKLNTTPGLNDVNTMDSGNMSTPVSPIYPTPPPTLPTYRPPFSTTTQSTIRPRPPYTYLPPVRVTTPRPRPPPQATHPPPFSGPATMSEPVPTLREFYAPSLQYHVGIYTKTFTPYMQICGGSLVKAAVVLSAAHCFWSDDVGVLRSALFAVAAGKLLRPWEIPRETFAQRSDVKDIKIPSRFRGGRTSFQDDIAIVMMTSAFEYAPGVLPVCVSFDLDLDRRQLKSGSMGTIAGWGLTQPNGLPSQRLNFLKLPYVDIDDCIMMAEPSFAKYITSDKICAGDQKTGRALCRGDSGGGLVYYNGTIPYIRGIASTAQRDSNECNAYAIASFTHVRAHRTFLEDHVPDIAEGCEELYIDETNTSIILQSMQNGTSQETTNTDLRERSETNNLFNHVNMQNLEQKSAQLESHTPPKLNTITRQRQNERTELDQMKIKTNGNGKEQTLDQKSGELGVVGVPMYNMMSRQSLDARNVVQTQMVNVTRKPTIQMMSQNALSKGEMATVVTTSWSQQPKLVMINLVSGERGVITVPVDGASAFVCDCLCRN